ncbi:hypothetical protein T439DRAFT_327214 [Meredithblackwellia eburnea MCA 4105]
MTFLRPRALAELSRSTSNCWCVLGNRPSNTVRNRTFASTSSIRATVVPDHLIFPSKSNPTPWEIFHIDPSSSPSAAELKARFYDLAKYYHPDRQQSLEIDVGGRGKGKDDSSEVFKQIVAAYEVLQSPTGRASYLRSRGSGAYGANGRVDPWAAYNFRRGNPMPSSRHWHASGEHWDWAGDPHNPHFRPSYSMGRTSTSGWKGEGTLSTNGTVFLGLIAFVLCVTPLSVWSAVPPELTRSSLASSSMSEEELQMLRSSGRVSTAYNRHEEASRALERARREARAGGAAKKEAIRQRARQVERQRAYERALEVERVERLERGTGHLSLPPPPTPPPPPAIVHKL